MDAFVDRHRNLLLTLVSVLGLGALLWLDLRQGEVATGQPLPALTLHQLAGDEPLSLTQLTGQPAVLDFWASWCGPCRESLPHVDALARRYEGRVRFFAINAESEPPEVQQELRQRLGLTLPILQDGAALAKSLGVSLLPTTVVLGRDGRVAVSFVGAVAPSRLAAALDALP